MPTQLETIIQQTVAASATANIVRRVDRMTDAAVDDIFSDKETRAKFTALIQKAIEVAFANLNKAQL